MKAISNFLTIDLEEWFVVEIHSKRFAQSDWEKLPSTIAKNSRDLLKMLRRRNVLATWFVVGWCAERHSDLLREIVDDGHEIACHSYRHIRVDRMDADSFRKDTEMAVEAIRSAAGVDPIGYRAPSWSIGVTVPWAFEVLANLGFTYDSSIFPIKHDIYGMPSGPRRPFKMNFSDGRTLWEFPASTYRFLGKNLPIAGGGFLRHFPFWYSRRIMRKLNRDDQPVNVYVHPWELDPDPPFIPGLGPLERLRSSRSTSLLAHKLERLLDEFEFIPIREHIRKVGKRRIGFQ